MFRIHVHVPHLGPAARAELKDDIARWASEEVGDLITRIDEKVAAMDRLVERVEDGDADAAGLLKLHALLEAQVIALTAIARQYASWGGSFTSPVAVSRLARLPKTEVTHA